MVSRPDPSVAKQTQKKTPLCRNAMVSHLQTIYIQCQKFYFSLIWNIVQTDVWQVQVIFSKLQI